MFSLRYKAMTPQSKLLFVVTASVSCGFYRGMLRHLKNAGFSVVMVSAAGRELDEIASAEGAASRTVAIEREISPFRDLVSLWKLYRVIKAEKPDLVDVSTPKAGLLGGTAAALAGVPCRIYTLRGLRLETACGWKRLLLWLAERLACACVHRVVPVSPSLRQRAIDLKLVSGEKARVLGKGSGGVDLGRFTPLRRNSSETASLRQTLGLTGQETVIGFVGRLVKDKGIHELVEAFGELSATIPDLRLLLVGDFEAGDPVDQALRKRIESAATIFETGFVEEPALYYPLMDVFVLPTHREGFPGVALEAQASGVPVVTTSATGAVDSVEDGVTGLVVPAGNTKALAEAIRTLLTSPALRTEMGRAGRHWMERDFHCEAVWDAHADLYRGMFAERSRSRAQRSLGLTRSLTLRSLTVKRAMDLGVATTALVLLSPLIGMIAALVRLFLGSPVLFRQIRPGYKGRSFTCLKFRTMTDERGEDGRLLPDRQRLTPVGRFLRRTSLDELPELINVVRGEMSLVGPRPLLVAYLDRYTAKQMRRHDVPPGITGWAQIHGRNAASWERKFALDLWYVEQRTLWLDLKILAATLWKTLRQDGISQSGHATAEEFMGRGESEIRSGARGEIRSEVRGEARGELI